MAQEVRELLRLPGSGHAGPLTFSLAGCVYVEGGYERLGLEWVLRLRSHAASVGGLHVGLSSGP